MITRLKRLLSSMAPQVIAMVYLLAFTSTVYGDVSTSNPHIATLQSWPSGSELTCIPCHGDPTTIEAEKVSANCIESCHQIEAGDVASSQHSNLKCIHCHPVLHIGDKDQESCNNECHSPGEERHDHNGNDNFASIWLIDESSLENDIALKEHFFSYSDPELMTLLGMATVEKGKIYMAYLNSQGITPGSSATRYVTCSNCHFETGIPEEIGVAKSFSQGIVKTGIQESELEFRNHRIGERNEEEFVVKGESLLSQILPTLGASAVIISLILLIVVRDRRERSGRRDAI